MDRMPQRLADVLEQIAQADPPLLSVPTPNACGKPLRVQHLLDDSAASRLYERFGSEAQSQSSSDASSRSADSAIPGKVRSASSKQSRYLREQDRCDIIHRMAAGEKQANLAREFGVTRAAICHIKKNRAEILARSIHRDARHPKRARYQTISKPLITQFSHQDCRSQLPVVYEVRSLPMTTLMTALRNKETSPNQFRHFTDRAIRLLLEEALACADTESIELVTPTGCICEGIQAKQTSCGIALGDDAFPMLDIFSAIHPESPAGYVSFSGANRSRGHKVSDLLTVTAESDMRLPPNLDLHAVFLMMPTCPTAWEVCAAVQTLVDHGALESSIFFVCIVTSASATSDICKRYPAIRIVTAAIDPHVNEVAICPGIGDFRSRYSAATISPSDKIEIIS